MNVRRIVCTIALAVAATLVAATAASEALAQSRRDMTQAALDTNNLEGGFNASSPELAPNAAAPITIEPAPEVVRPQVPPRAGAREPRGNPLWAIPLKSLTATRERPIFLPSRRAFAPAIAGPPPPPPPPGPAPPKEPDRPRLALVGAVVGEAEGIAVFLDQTNQAIVRLRTGENHSGWILRSVKGREATLQKDRETVLLALPAPTDPTVMPGIPGMPGLPPLPTQPGGPRLIPGTNQPEL